MVEGVEDFLCFTLGRHYKRQIEKGDPHAHRLFITAMVVAGVDVSVYPLGVDVSVSTLGVDVSVCTLGVDVRVYTLGVDVRVYTLGVDVRRDS